MMSQSAQSIYAPILTALGPYFPQIVSAWSPPRRLSMDGVAASYAITVTNDDGSTSVYVATFVLDQSGNWVIDSM